MVVKNNEESTVDEVEMPADTLSQNEVEAENKDDSLQDSHIEESAENAEFKAVNDDDADSEEEFPTVIITFKFLIEISVECKNLN